MSMMELKKMMIRMVVTKAKSRDKLNCDFDDRYYDGDDDDEADDDDVDYDNRDFDVDNPDDGDGPSLNVSGSPSLNGSLDRWLLASQVSRRSNLYPQHLPLCTKT